MKLVKSTLLSTLFTGVLFFGLSTIQAHEHEAGHDPHHEKVATDPTGATSESAATALSSLDGFIDSVTTDLSTGKMNRIHEFAEGMNEAIKNLGQDSTLDPTKKKRVQGYIKNIEKLTDSMHDAADEKKLDETKKWAKKLKVQADLLDKQFITKSKKE